MTLEESAVSSAAGWRLDHSYARLPERLYAEVRPAVVRDPGLVLFNGALAGELGLDREVLGREENAGLFAGNALPGGARPIAQAYAGHQFGHFTILGDGRAILLGEQVTPGGVRYDIQLKGAGATPYSRRGDGRAALGPMLREYVISEAMHALGIPTTRSLAVASTGEPVFRERPLPGAVLTRVAASHIRVGTFEWAAAHGDLEALRALAEHTLERHYPALRGAEEPHTALLEAVVAAQAGLVARWMLVGFVHGVMNTDNMALSGETIDYGPCAFMEAYDPATVFSSIDTHGRYAYGNQPVIAQWNLARLAEAMLPLLDPDEGRALERAQRAVGSFAGRYNDAWLSGMRAKLGLFTAEDGDRGLIDGLLEHLRANRIDFTNAFRDLSGEARPGTGWAADAAFEGWHRAWVERLGRQPQTRTEVAEHMRRHNPAVIPRNLKVEEALAAVEGGDPGPLRRLLGILARPYDGTGVPSEYTVPAGAECGRYRTFCGT